LVQPQLLPNFAVTIHPIAMKMKPVLPLIILAGLFFSAGCLTDPNEAINEKALTDKDFTTEIAWTQTEKDLGTIEEGQKIEIAFEFTNKGKKPLVIKNVTATCGCTVPEIPKEPVMPGQKGLIKAVFDSQGRAGANQKTISVDANTLPEGSHILNFSVNVNARPETPQTAQ
jgi:Protein of unknown function (DUF1573)